MRTEPKLSPRPPLVRILVRGLTVLAIVGAVVGPQVASDGAGAAPLTQSTEESEPSDTEPVEESEPSVTEPAEETVPSDTEPAQGSEPAELEPGGVSTATWVGAIALLVVAVVWATYATTRRTSSGDASAGDSA
ncbi:MAG: hypothetical protein ACR2QO_25525 [Acidimicrobiales bacterium]